MKLSALATGAATTTLVLGAVVSLAPGQSTPPSTPSVVPVKFDHKAHAELETPVTVAECGQCHGSDHSGAVGRPASHGHQPCLTSGCHAEDFLSVGTRTKTDAPERYRKAAGFCLGCHQDGAGQAPRPFTKAEANNLYQNNTKLGHYVEMNHLAHTKVAKANGGGCRTCHVVDSTTLALAPEGPGHSECVTCHDGEAADKGAKARTQPEFAMDDCSRCHQSGDPASYFKERKFSTDVRSCKSLRHAALSQKNKAKTPCFEHEHKGHRTRENGEKLQCGHCHFMFSSKQYEGHGYQSLREIKQAPLMDNSRDRAHNKCGTSGCHRSAVDESQGAGRCSLCHSSKSVLGSLVDGPSPRGSSLAPLTDGPEDKKDKPRKRKRRKRHSLDDLVN